MGKPIKSSMVTGYPGRLEPAPALSPCSNPPPAVGRTRRAQAQPTQARQRLHECVPLPDQDSGPGCITEIVQPPASSATALILEAKVQHTFERLIVGRMVFRKGWRLWVMRELFKLEDGPLSTQVINKLITFLKDTHYR